MEPTPLHVEAHGEGAGLVLAHGFGGSARNWRPQVRAFKERHRVVTFDARGHGRSAAPTGADAYTRDAFVSDLDRVVTGCGDPHPVVGGLSMGAAVALEWALDHPGVARGLILSSFPAGAASGRGISGSAHAFGDAIDRDGLEAAGERFAWGPGSGLDGRGRALVKQGFMEHAPHALAHTLREFLSKSGNPSDRAADLAAAPCPVLLIAGSLDALSVDASQGLASARPDAVLEIIPEAGHVVNLAAPTAYNAAVERFLSTLPAAPDDSR